MFLVKLQIFKGSSLKKYIKNELDDVSRKKPVDDWQIYPYKNVFYKIIRGWRLSFLPALAYKKLEAPRILLVSDKQEASQILRIIGFTKYLTETLKKSIVFTQNYQLSDCNGTRTKWFTN